MTHCSGSTPIARLNAEVTRALKNPEVHESYLKAGLEPAPNSPDEMRRMMRTEYEKWGLVIQTAGIKGE